MSYVPPSAVVMSASLALTIKLYEWTSPAAKAGEVIYGLDILLACLCAVMICVFLGGVVLACCEVDKARRRQLDQ